MKDNALAVCPECGGLLRKVFGAPMISFKGSGFYATDHGKKSKSAEKSSEHQDSKQDSKQGADSASTSSADAKDSGEKKSSDMAPATKTEPSSGSKGESETTTKKEPTT